MGKKTTWMTISTKYRENDGTPTTPDVTHDNEDGKCIRKKRARSEVNALHRYATEQEKGTGSGGNRKKMCGKSEA